MVAEKERRFAHLHVIFGLLCFHTFLPAAGEGSTKLIEELRSSPSEAAARELLKPQMALLKELDSEVFDIAVKRNWWNLSREIVGRSHSQNVDLSAPVRKAVQRMKEEADELVRLLNPKYGVAQKVSPAFQWAQNDTCIFMTIKYTVRWNAPGALELADAQVNVSKNTFVLSGFGKHSNNKYHYLLNLSLFDDIVSEQSTWNFASAAKASVTLRKKWGRRWPRLLSQKGLKVGNMQQWNDMQDRLDPALEGVLKAANSPATCAASENKYYCLAKDSCRTAEQCAECPDKTSPNLEANLCTGLPSQSASVVFQDEDMDKGEIGGVVRIGKPANQFDIDSFAVYFGTDKSTRLTLEGGEYHIVGEIRPTEVNSSVRLPTNTPVPSGAKFLLVFSRNDHGEHAVPGSVEIKDAAIPLAKPLGVSFSDTHADKGFVAGRIEIARAEDEEGSMISHYSLYWGRSPTKKITGAAEITGSVKAETGNTWLDRHKIPAGAKYILAYSKNDDGEFPSPVSIPLIDHAKPCVNASDGDCPRALAVQTSEAQITFSVKPAKKESALGFGYAFYWGIQACEALTSCRWRQTGKCDPNGPREESQDKACTEKIPKGASGFCDYDGDGNLSDGEPGYGCSDEKGDNSCHSVRKASLMSGPSPLIQELHGAAERTLTVKREEQAASYPQGTTHVLVFSKNELGESDHCVSAAFLDDHPHARREPVPAEPPKPPEPPESKT